MTQERLDSLRRVLAVQKKLHQMAQWRLAEIQREDTTLQQRQRDLLKLLDEGESCSALFATTAMRRLRSIAENRAALTTAQKQQVARVDEERQRLGRAERLVGTLAEEEHREMEKRELTAAIEASLQRPPASLP